MLIANALGRSWEVHRRWGSFNPDAVPDSAGARRRSANRRSALGAPPPFTQHGHAPTTTPPISDLSTRRSPRLRSALQLDPLVRGDDLSPLGVDRHDLHRGVIPRD